ncbi:MAG: TniB family NTP-binding protein [Hydrogenophilales bacterium]|nr:TniB family NTP-binding protein [Hydrogenophilales bacterium]
MSSIFILYPLISDICDECIRRMQRVMITGKSDSFLVICPTGGGKTSLAQYIKSLYPDKEEEEGSIRNILVFSIPAKPSTRTIPSAMLKELGDPIYDKGNAGALIDRLKILLKECKTHLIIIDNVHDIPERRKRKGVREIGNMFRDLMEGVPALYLFIGLDISLEVTKSNNQVRRRSMAVKEIKYFTCNDNAGVSMFRRFLYELDKRLPIAELSGLESFDLTCRLWMASYGILDCLIKIVVEAMSIVVGDSREKITLEDFSKGYKKYLLDATPTVDPFDKNTQTRLLDRAGEPFEDWFEDGYS